jgi:hypothetical protein
VKSTGDEGRLATVFMGLSEGKEQAMESVYLAKYGVGLRPEPAATLVNLSSLTFSVVSLASLNTHGFGELFWLPMKAGRIAAEDLGGSSRAGFRVVN